MILKQKEVIKDIIQDIDEVYVDMHFDKTTPNVLKYMAVLEAAIEKMRKLILK